MTKVGQLIQEEIIEAFNNGVNQEAIKAAAEKESIAKSLLRNGVDPSVITESTGLTEADVRSISLS
jgi:predicted transposase/invertase (TIGR01784 family)